MNIKSLIPVLFTVSTLVAAVSSADPIYAKSVSKSATVDLDPNFASPNENYYACDSAQANAEKFLQTLGATNVHVTCSGGIQQGVPTFGWDATLDIQLTALQLSSNSDVGAVAATYKQGQFHSPDNCALYAQIWQSVQSDLALANVHGTTTCMDGNDSFTLSFSSLAAQ